MRPSAFLTGAFQLVFYNFETIDHSIELLLDVDRFRSDDGYFLDPCRTLSSRLWPVFAISPSVRHRTFARSHCDRLWPSWPISWRCSPDLESWLSWRRGGWCGVLRQIRFRRRQRHPLLQFPVRITADRTYLSTKRPICSSTFAFAAPPGSSNWHEASSGVAEASPFSRPQRNPRIDACHPSPLGIGSQLERFQFNRVHIQLP